MVGVKMSEEILEAGKTSNGAMIYGFITEIYRL